MLDVSDGLMNVLLPCVGLGCQGADGVCFDMPNDALAEGGVQWDTHRGVIWWLPQWRIVGVAF